MPLEFASDEDLTDEQWAGLRKWLAFRFVVLPETNAREIRLRWDITSHRSAWAEDITIFVEPQLRVRVHVGDARQISELVECVEHILQCALTPTSDEWARLLERSSVRTSSFFGEAQKNRK
ncbi:MAG: hypothetical protein AB8H86_15535 [Polyangiales bacterium]